MMLMALFDSTIAAGNELHLVSLREFSMEYYSVANHRDTYMQYADPADEGSEEAWIGGTAVSFNLDLLKRGDWGLYWNNRVHGEGTDAQFREVGWQFETGLQLGADLQLYMHHHSRHVLDAERDERFPLDNFYGARVTFYRRPE
jgi:hypothetical protein